MNERDGVLVRIVSGQLGIVTWRQALDAGLSPQYVREQSANQVLLPMYEGVYRHAAVPLTWQGRLLAAIFAAGPLAVASHRSAARLDDLRGVPRWRPEITVPTLDLPLRSGIQVHRTNVLDARDITVVDGVPCTTVARTCLDLGAVVPYEVVELAVQDAIIRNLVTHAQLFSVLERVAGRGRRGSAALRAVVRHALPDELLESELERLLLALFPKGHPFVLQHPFRCVDGRQVRFDTAWPEARIAVEANGRRWHSTTKDRRRDAERRRSLEESGWTMYEYGWADVTERPASVSAEIEALIRLAA